MGTLMLKITMSSPRGEILFETEMTANETVEDIKNYIVEKMVDNEAAIEIYRLNGLRRKHSVSEIKNRLVILYNGKKISDRIPISILNTTGTVFLQFDVRKGEEGSNYIIEHNKIENSIDEKECQKGAGSSFQYLSESSVTEQQCPAQTSAEDRKIKDSDVDSNVNDNITFEDTPLSNSSLNNEEDDIEMRQIERNVSVRNLLTGKLMAVDPRKVVKRGGRMYYLSPQPEVASEDTILKRFEWILLFVTPETIIKASMIIALFYSGNSPMACVLLMIFVLTFLSNQSLFNLSFTNTSFYEKVGKMAYSFVASMFLLSFESSAY
ncbi:hypothetical protein THOM_2984 [Trachipleistophora hominis]|uniref:Ubiquitin-like domain-containing protein n=1 Tax=Trachipleistophora hominis TaxID=72359 RepID=L7JRI9_TRAHO|nr:hypothetical protein THOM_2984 [Trachipleistophora hominis]